MTTRLVAIASLVVGSLGAQLHAQGVAEPVPEPAVVIERACQAAGGWDAFKNGGVLKLQVSLEEITQDGKTQKSTSYYMMALPGPSPARFESTGVLAGDDGVKGWALVNGKPDGRPATAVMVRRLVQSDLFALLLPFSFHWDGVVVTEVRPAELDGRPVWRLTVEFLRTFFASPQTATRWIVDVDRRTWEVVGAVSPATDLGRGITADGLRYAWSKPVKVGSMTLRGEERVVGLDDQGKEKAHTRTRTASFELMPRAKAGAAFENPIPPDQRPKPPMAGVPPPNLQPLPK